MKLEQRMSLSSHGEAKKGKQFLWRRFVLLVITNLPIGLFELFCVSSLLAATSVPCLQRAWPRNPHFMTDELIIFNKALEQDNSYSSLIESHRRK